ncbi:MAG TPA: hypothetical protein ENH94_08360 [Phycisphaerales bacterium]|nr:hypothetical protein [Phycisphaerales bacterium]
MKPADDIKRFFKNASLSTDPAADEAVFDKVLKAGNTKTTIPAHQPSIWRIIMQSKITKLTAAAAIILVAITIINQFGGSIDGTSVAFANAMEHFAAAETARFDLTIEFGDQQPQTSSFLYDAKGYIRQNMANGVVNFVDYNTNKVLSFVPDSKIVVIKNVSKPDFNTALYDIFAKFQDLIQQAIDIGQGPVESLDTKTIDGYNAYGYRVETTGQLPGLYWQGKGTLTVWADAETDFPLILKWRNTMTDIAVTVSNIRLNEIFGPDELSIMIPDGFAINDETIPQVEPEPQEPLALQENIIESDDTVETTPQQPEINETVEHDIDDLIKGLEKNDQTLIKFFHSFCFLTKGKFPSSLTFDAVKDIDPDAKITYKQKLWSHSVSVSFPNLMKDAIPCIDPDTLTEEEIKQINQQKGPIYEEEMARSNEEHGYLMPHFDNIVEGLKLINKLPAKSDWCYNGQDSTLGDADIAIFWYKPKKSKTYRAVYGDLTIEEVSPDDLHLLENPSDDEIDQQANAVLETAIQLGADIPKGSRNKVLRILSLKEKDLIRGFAIYLEYSPGRYPPSMTVDKNYMKDMEALFSEAMKQGRIDKKTSEEKVFDLFYAGSFYDKLVREKKGPVYYGAAATLSDPNAILVRWKLSKNKYRVIYTSLKAETVTTEKLAELENQPTQ